MTRDEAIGRIKARFDKWALDDEDMKAIQILIPELRESEDEKFRKYILQCCKECIEANDKGLELSMSTTKKLLAYLEKQKEPLMSAEGVLVRAGLKPYRDGNQWCVLAGDNIQEGICGFGDTIDEALYQFLMEVLEKQKENPKSADSIPSDCTSDAKYEDRWHKVGDSLPDNGREVLAKDKLGNTLLARYDGEGWDVSVYDDADYRCHNGISKWCEIPSEKQKEQKPIIQDVELNDAVYDYVRDHFIAGADFTPEYIKKLMENAFFAGVDYYLLKQEFESCEPDTNVEKVIEDVIRVYGKTQGEWVGGYDVDTLIVNLRRAFNKKEQKPVDYDHEMWKNCEANFEGGKKEVIEHPEKYGLTKQKPADLTKMLVHKEPYLAPVPIPMVADEQKPVEPSDDKLQRHQDELHDFKLFATRQAKEHHISISFVHDFEWNNFCEELLSLFNEQKPVSISCGHENDAGWSEEEKGKVAEYLHERDGGMLWSRAKDITDDILDILRPQKLDASKLENFDPVDVLNRIKTEWPMAWEKVVGRQEWSEEDEKTISDACCWIAEYAGYLMDKNYGKASMLMSLTEKLKSLRPQPKQEWSEDDERRRDGIIQWLREYQKEFNPKYDSLSIESIESLIDWLKSLRPHWKPSEEQMKALLNAEGFLRAGLQHDSAKTIADLYEQLKKL